MFAVVTIEDDEGSVPVWIGTSIAHNVKKCPVHLKGLLHASKGIGKTFNAATPFSTATRHEELLGIDHEKVQGTPSMDYPPPISMRDRRRCLRNAISHQM
eukprot:5645904-Amphidinium_carterae.1